MSTLYKRLNKWVKEKSQSNLAQWLASIATGASLSSGVHYIIDLFTKISIPDEVATGITYANYAISTVVLFTTTGMARHKIYKAMTSSHQFEKTVLKLEEENTEKERLIKENHEHILKLSTVLAKISQANPKLTAEITQEIQDLQTEIEEKITVLSRPRSSSDIAISVQALNSTSIGLHSLSSSTKQSLSRESTLLDNEDDEKTHNLITTDFVAL